MQKILSFEIAMAVRDRPKVFQVVTLVLLAFSFTVILIASITRLSSAGSNNEVFKNIEVNDYAEWNSAPSRTMLHLQK